MGGVQEEGRTRALPVRSAPCAPGRQGQCIGPHPSGWKRCMRFARAVCHARAPQRAAVAVNSHPHRGGRACKQCISFQRCASLPLRPRARASACWPPPASPRTTGPGACRQSPPRSSTPAISRQSPARWGSCCSRRTGPMPPRCCCIGRARLQCMRAVGRGGVAGKRPRRRPGRSCGARRC